MSCSAIARIDNNRFLNALQKNRLKISEWTKKNTSTKINKICSECYLLNSKEHFIIHISCAVWHCAYLWCKTSRLQRVMAINWQNHSMDLFNQTALIGSNIIDWCGFFGVRKISVWQKTVMTWRSHEMWWRRVRTITK